MDNDYFYDSIPDGLSNALQEIDDEIECSNFDSINILSTVFGRQFSSNDLQQITETSFQKLAECIKDYFELTEFSVEDAEKVLDRALKQWDG